MADKSPSNRLIDEKSPYLLQHAHNPVDWHPWSDEAFALAKKTNKPVLVSIGYATCHWCHVMERESFENPETARLLNQTFIAIKVDREERPDVDSVYMKAVQALGQQGGWPLNVFLTPDGIPFYGGTYFPPVARHNLPSFQDVIRFLDNTWKNEHDKVVKQSQALIDYLKDATSQENSATPTALGFSGEDQAAKLYKEHYDSLNHGFKFQKQNKFPASMGLSVLLRHFHRTKNKDSLDMVTHTLRAMKQGGIYDQIGGGLSRYSTDYKWIVPHFEKMLYDNALFVIAMIECFQVTEDKQFASHAEDILDYIDRDMTSGEGGFFSAEDADSEGVEGKFYVWDLKEVEEAVDRETASVIIPFYNISANGNWEKKNILHLTKSENELAKELGLDPHQVTKAIETGREKLLAIRSKRIRPLLDDKVLTSWNALMISAMAKSGRVLDDTDRIDKARRGFDFIWQNLRTEEGKLLRRYREGDARYDAYLFDYSSLALSCLDLYEATYENAYLEKAKILMDYVDIHFASSGAYYETADDAKSLIVRQISGYDGVEPSGNSMAAFAWLKLSAYFQDESLTEKAQRIFSVFSDDLMKYGLNSSFMMKALHLHLSGKKEISVILNRDDPEGNKILIHLRKTFLPNAVVAVCFDDEPEENRPPILSQKNSIDGKTTIYLCKQGVCLPPLFTLTELAQHLTYPE